MDNVVVKYFSKPKLKKPVLVEGLPGIGLVGKLAGDHLLDELEAKKFAEFISPHLPPQVSIKEDGTVELVKMHFYYWKGKKKDVILLLGDFQGLTTDSQYQLAEETIKVAEKFNVERIYTLGGLGTGTITKNPKVFGAATSSKLVKEHEKHDVVFRGGGAIFGASGLLLGLGMEHGIDAVCLMGETHGQIIDAKSAEAVLMVLTKILDIEVDMGELEKKAKETEQQLNQMRQMIKEQKEAMDRQQEFIDEIPTYIR